MSSCKWTWTETIQGDIDATQPASRCSLPRPRRVRQRRARHQRLPPMPEQNQWSTQGSLTPSRYYFVLAPHNCQLTIQLEHIGGENNYKTPPLPKGEILGGITGILESDVHRTRPRTRDLYGMYDNQHKAGKPSRQLIEAIFNPVPTHSEKENSFTFYVPYALQLTKKGSQITLASTGGSSSLNGRGSIHSTATGSDYASVPSHSPSGKPLSLSSHTGHSLFKPWAQGTAVSLELWWRRKTQALAAEDRRRLRIAVGQKSCLF